MTAFAQRCFRLFVFNELSSRVLIFLTHKKQQTFYASDGFGTRSLKVIGLMILQTKLRCLTGGQVVQYKGPVRPSKIRALIQDL